jgi:hypothetical protein
VEWCPAYYGRGDDWGLATNPVSGKTVHAFFVSFGAWGMQREPRHTARLTCLANCVGFLEVASTSLCGPQSGFEPV